MTDFVKKYRVDDALTRLIAKYPEAFSDSKFFKHKKLEEVVPVNDPDMATIRVFRNAIMISDWKRQMAERRKLNGKISSKRRTRKSHRR